MVKKKAHVIMACRNAEKGKKALRDLKNEYHDASAELRIVDMSNKSSVKAFSAGIMNDFTRVDILVNNAGIMLTESSMVDGADITLATNAFGPYLLTGLLLPLLEKTRNSRIVCVSSRAYKDATVEKLEELNNATRTDFRWRFKRYQVSKVMNILFAKKLAKALAEQGSSAICVACHPGLSVSDLVDKASEAPMITKSYPTMIAVGIIQSAEMGAAPILMAATDPKLKGGDFIGPCGVREITGWPTHNPTLNLANDVEGFGVTAWKWCEDWTGFKYQF
jgi:NAD(P)-dependent dehydrogenase (short-subunit alcohol dehydrogenase family)